LNWNFILLLDIFIERCRQYCVFLQFRFRWRLLLLFLEVGNVLSEEVVLFSVIGGSRLALFIEGIDDILLLMTGLVFLGWFQTSLAVVEL
jgi:hypothetical protein